jgi:hypothetical protein
MNNNGNLALPEFGAVCAQQPPSKPEFAQDMVAIGVEIGGAGTY